MSVTSQHSPTVLAAAAQGITARISAAGVDPETVLSEVGLRPSDLADPTRRIGLSQYCGAFEAAARHTTRIHFGLEFGMSFHPQQLGLLGYLAISAPTLGAGLRKFAAYLPAHQQATRMELCNSTGASAVVEYAIIDASIQHRQQDAELSIAMLFNLFRHCHGSRWVPLGVHLMHTKPPVRTRYEELFGTRPRFSQSSNRIVFRRSDLDCPMPRQDERLMRLMETELQKQLPRRGDDVLARARHEIALALESGSSDLERISAHCGLQPWTLKRRLKKKGMTFHDLVAGTRYELALQHLARGTPVTEIATTLGYSEVSAFSRAFRQWAGVSPRKFLASRQG